MNQDLQSRLDLLERTILDLGTQLYEVKGRLAKSQEKQASMVELLHGIRHLLDEKGLLCAEDFDAAVDLSTAVSPLGHGDDGGPDRVRDKPDDEGH